MFPKGPRGHGCDVLLASKTIIYTSYITHTHHTHTLHPPLATVPVVYFPTTHAGEAEVGLEDNEDGMGRWRVTGGTVGHWQLQPMTAPMKKEVADVA